MCYLPTPDVPCPICGQLVSLYPEPDQLRRRACGHFVDIHPETGSVGATRDLAGTALLLARLADGQRGAERVHLRAAIEKAKRIPLQSPAGAVYQPAGVAGRE